MSDAPGFAERESRAQEAWDATRNARRNLDGSPSQKPMSHDYRAGYHQALIDQARTTNPTPVVLAARAGGKTQRMIDAILDRANERGVQVEVIQPPEWEGTTRIQQALAVAISILGERAARADPDHPIVEDVRILTDLREQCKPR